MATASQASLLGTESELDSRQCGSEPNKKIRHMGMACATKSKSKSKSKVSPVPSIKVAVADVVEPHKSTVPSVPTEGSVTDVEPQEGMISSVPTNRVVADDDVEPHESKVSPVPTDTVVINDVEPHESKGFPVPTNRVVADDDVEPRESKVSPFPINNFVADDDVKPHESKVSPVPLNNLIIDVVEPQPCFPYIGRSSLSQLVKQKNLNQLVDYGGIPGLANALRTNLKTGINGDDEDMSRRWESFGRNMYPKPPTKSLCHFAWEALKDPTILILFICAALSLGFGIKESEPKEGWYEGGIIFVAAFLVATSSFWQKRLFVKLSKASNNILVKVVRNGRQQEVSIFEIVVGDVVILKIGDQVPADGLFIDGNSLQVDEPRTTGQSHHVHVNEQNRFLFFGTMVIDGSGRMLVTSVGVNTTWMLSTINCEPNMQTRLQAQLNNLTSSIRKLHLVAFFLVLMILLVRYFTRNTKDENGNIEFNGSKTKVDDVIKSVKRIVAVIVTVMVTIPEGLPLVITLTLAYTMKTMAAHKVMVRNLCACETVDSITIICTEKTGILTLNQMKVTKFWLGRLSVDERVSTSIANNVHELLYQAVGLNTTYTVQNSPSRFEFEFSGNSIEKAILNWAIQELNMDMEQLKQNYTILHVEPFNLIKKRSGISIRKMADNTINVHWKGAADMVLSMCSQYYDFSGNIKALDDDGRYEFDQIIQGMANSGLRCIAFAHKQVLEDVNEDEEAQRNMKDDCLTLLALLGIKDPCRPHVKSHVEEIQYIGRNIKMITDDNSFTAKAIATECGILRSNQDDGVAEGVEFRNYDLEEQMNNVENINVMARSSPLDKLLMVQCLKQKEHVVAVIGKCTNDVPALKEADLGLYMGTLGNEVAEESSDIVILDNDFHVVALVLLWGRYVHNNIQKFIQLHLTMNVVALAINFVAAVSVGEVPLNVVQLLWVNLILDTTGALALVMGNSFKEANTKELREKIPMDHTKPLITNIVLRNLIARALYQITILLTIQFRGKSIFRVNGNINNTLIFNTFVIFQVFEGMPKNKLFLVIIGITIVLQVVMVEFLKKFANMEPLNWWQWGVCIGLVVVYWPIGWLVNCI